MERRWKRNVVSVVSSVIAVILLPSVYSRHLFWGRGNSPHPKRLANCAINFFSVGTTSYQYIAETFFLTNYKHRKLFVIKQSKGCKFMPEMHQNTFGGRTPPGPAGGAYAFQTP